MVDRTPIKIPGKNNRDQSKAAKATRQALNRSRGRPLKLYKKDNDVAPPAPIVKPTKKRTLKNIKSKKKMSQLERLPTELLEKVFLYCLNLDLPRASPIIGAKLSSEAVYMRTILFAFKPQWDANFCEQSSQLLGEDRLEEDLLMICFGDEADLQSSILRCRWATVAVLLKGMDFWDHRTAAARPNEPACLPFDRYARNINLQDSYIDIDLFGDLPINSDLTTIDTSPAQESTLAIFEDAFSRFSSIVTNRNFSLYNYLRYQEKQCLLARGVELPHTILRGPWTEETIEYLFWVMDAGGELNWTTSTTGEIALRGYKDAVMAGNLRVALLLQKIGLWEKVDIDLLIWVLQNVGGDRHLKFTMLYQILAREHVLVTLDESKRYRFRQALAHERDKAERIQDQETLHFLDRIEESDIML